MSLSVQNKPMYFSAAASVPVTPKQITSSQPMFGATANDGPEEADGGEPAAELSAEALRAIFMPGNAGKIKMDADAKLAQRMAESGVEEMADVLDRAQKLAGMLGQPEANALHVMAVIFGDLEADMKNVKSPTVQDALKEQIEQGTTLLGAVVGPYSDVTSLEEMSIYLKDSARDVRAKLEALPKGKTADSVPLSKNLRRVFNERMDELDAERSSPELINKRATKMFLSELQQNQPETFAALAQQESELKDAFRQLYAQIQEADAPYDERFEAIDKEGNEAEEALYAVAPEPLKQAFDQIKPIVDGFEEFENALEEGRVRRVQGDSAEIEAEYERLQQEAEQAREEFNTLLKDEYPDLFAQYIQPIIDKAEAVEKEKEENEELQALYTQFEEAKKKVEDWDAMHDANVGVVAEKLVNNEQAQYYREIVTAPFADEIDPKFLEDSATKQAYEVYKDLRGLCGEDLRVTMGDFERYIRRAKRNGAGKEQIQTLNAHSSMIKTAIDMLMGDGSEESKPFLMKQVQLLTRFAKAYAGVDWRSIGKKKVDLADVKEVLDRHIDLPKPIKNDIVNFVKKGNQNNWMGQPMLILSSEEGNDFLRKQVMEVLGEIIDMPVFRATVSEDESPMARLMRGPKLSVAAEAIMATGTPQSLVYIDNLTRFLVNGGEGQFEQFSSGESRTAFKEKDMGAPLDVSPFVFVASADNDIVNAIARLYSDRFNESDISLINLDVDIDIFARKRAAFNHFLKPIEAEYNVVFGEEVVDKMARDYAVAARIDEMEYYLREAAREASGQNFSDEPVTITPEDLPKLLGPERSRYFVHHMPQPEVGKVHILGTLGDAYGSMDRLSIHTLNQGEYNEKTDKEGQYHVKRLLIGTGGASTMFEDSARTLEGMLEKMTTGELKSNDGREYARMRTRKNRMIFNVKAPDRTEGPSAGLAMQLAAVSAATGIAVRNDVAMTGTLSSGDDAGEIGGQFLKIQAGYHNGHIKKFMLPKNNYDELLFEHPKFVQKLKDEGVEIIGVESVDDVLRNGLTDYEKLFEPLPEEPKQSRWKNGVASLKQRIFRSSAAA